MGRTSSLEIPMGQSIQFDNTKLADIIDETIRGELQDILGDIAEDLDTTIRQISARMAIAARRKRPDLVEACKDQLLMAVETRRATIEENLVPRLDNLLIYGIDFLFNGALGAFSTIKVQPG